MRVFSFLIQSEGPEQKTTIGRRENRTEAILAKPTSGCACALVSLLRAVVGFLPCPTNGVGFQPTCGFEPRWISSFAEPTQRIAGWLLARSKSKVINGPGGSIRLRPGCLPLGAP